MEKPVYISYNHLEISCLQNKLTGPAIVFLHGSSQSAQTFQAQFADPALQKYRIIAIDFPGHGRSAWATDPENTYNLFFLRDAVLHVIQVLGCSSFVFAGHSLGGHVAMECLPFVSGCHGLFIWGAPPVRLPLDTSVLFRPDPRAGLLFKPELNSMEISSLASIFTSAGHQEMAKSMIAETDPDFRKYLPLSFSQAKLSDEYTLIKAAGIPVAIIDSENDELVNPDYYQTLDLNFLWRGGPSHIENAAHSPQLENPLLFNNLLLEFVDQAFQ